MSTEGSAIDGLEDAARTVITTPTSTDGESVDLLGRIRKVETDLADHRRSMISEMQGHEAGEHYELSSRPSARRTYNPTRIIIDVADALKADPLAALSWLVNQRIINMDKAISWSQLQRHFKTLGIELVRYDGELDSPDLNDAHFGVVWKDYIRVVGRERQDDEDKK